MYKTAIYRPYTLPYTSYEPYPGNGGGGSGGNGASPPSKPYIIWQGKYYTEDNFSQLLSLANEESLKELFRVGYAQFQTWAINMIPQNMGMLRTLASFVTFGLYTALASYLESMVSHYSEWHSGMLQEVLRRAPALATQDIPWPEEKRIAKVDTVVVEASVATGLQQNKAVPVGFVLPCSSNVQIDWSMWAHDVFMGIGDIGTDVYVIGHSAGGGADAIKFHEHVEGGTYIIDGGKSGSGSTVKSLPAGEYILLASAGYTSNARIKVTYKIPYMVPTGIGISGKSLLIAGIVLLAVLYLSRGGEQPWRT